MNYFTFYCDEICADLECELEYEEAEPEVGLEASMTLVSAMLKTAPGLDIFSILKLELVDEIEAAALKTPRTTDHDYDYDHDYVCQKEK